MRLHHITRRSRCGSIAEHGFWDSEGQYGRGVYLSAPNTLWFCSEPDEDLEYVLAALKPEFVVFAFDVPDDIAAPHVVLTETEFGEEIDPEEDLDDTCSPQVDGPTESGPPGAILCYCLPADLANKYCAGVIHWKGDPPLTDAQLAQISAWSTVPVVQAKWQPGN